MDFSHSHSPKDIAQRLSKGPEINYLRDWIYGGIDGAVTTFAIVAGVVGAQLSTGVVLVLGLANLIADGLSMAASNYSGTKADNDDYDRLKAFEIKQIEKDPEGEREEVRQIYLAKGYEGEDLDKIVDLITSKKEMWIDVMMAEEYGLSATKRSPFKAAFTTFWAFIVCGAVPLVPFALSLPASALTAAIATGVTFFAIGAAKARWSTQSWWSSGIETTIIGLGAAGVAYLIGALLEPLL